MSTLYRKYRPQNFGEIAGQVPLIQLLQNSLTQKKLHQAYLFTGPRGTGKTSIARIFAKAINCPTPQGFEPCNQCEACLGITAGTCVDVFEIDAASNRGIEEIRDLREKIRYMPVQLQKKIYIIDEVHMLTNEAFNALLKTLEEPPAHVVFILATTELHKVPLTIRSRCQQLDFQPLKIEVLAQQLLKVAQSENISLTPEVARAVGKHSQGGMRDALSLLDQLRSFCANRSITLADFQNLMGGISPDKLQNFMHALSQKNLNVLLEVSNQLLTSGTQLAVLLDQLLEALQIMLLIKLQLSGSLDLLPEELSLWQNLANQFQTETLQAVIDRFLMLRGNLRYEIQPKIIWELFLIKECSGTTKESLAPAKAEQVNKHVQIENTEKPIVAAITPTAAPIQKIIPATAPASPSSNGEISLNGVISRWDEILGQVKQKKVQTYMLMTECHPIAFEDKTLTLQFKANCQFHMDKLLQPPHRECLQDILKIVLGNTVALKAVIEGVATAPINKVPTAGSQILSVFGGKVL
jgi:DNA polymerase-3 subunit gamma/tau